VSWPRCLSIPLTQGLIADALGLTTVHVNRTLRALREDKLIEVDGRSITIMDFETLSQLSDFENAYLADVFPTSQDAALRITSGAVSRSRPATADNAYWRRRNRSRCRAEFSPAADPPPAQRQYRCGNHRTRVGPGKKH
jgi:hypothetical protein